jgi:hypothetical protein
MKGVVLVSGFFLVASMVLSTIHAQDQPAPGSGSELTADYPMDRGGVLIQGAQWMAVTSQTPSKTKIAHGLAASLSYGIAPAKIVAEYEGEHAPTQVAIARPILCLCHIFSLPGDPVLVRLHPKKGTRELNGGKMIVYPIVGGSKMADANRSDLILADVSHPDPQIWLLRPQSYLEPGEYALMLGTQNVIIYPFTVVAPPVHPTGAN